MEVHEARETFAKIAKAVNCYQIGYSDLNKLIRSYFNVADFNFAYCKECLNDSQHLIRVRREDSRSFEESWWRKWSAPEIALNRLCCDGVIPPGEYLISVCW